MSTRPSISRLLLRVARDRRGTGLAESAFLVMGSLVLFLTLIVFFPMAFMRVQRVEAGAVLLADILAREAVWTDAKLEALVRDVGARLDEAPDLTVSVGAGRIYLDPADPERTVAYLCRGSRFALADGSTRIIEGNNGGTRTVLAGLPQLSPAASTSYVFVAEISGAMKVAGFTYTIRKVATSRPLLGVIRIQPVGTTVPTLCT